MRRIFLQWRGITVWSYPAMLYFGLVTGIVAGNAIAKADGLDSRAIFIATCILILPALAGARLLYVVTHRDLFRNDLKQIWDTKDGGQAQYGGILLAVPLSIPLLRLLGVGFGEFWDIASFTIMTGMTFTRVGCLMNGCCAGRQSNAWGCLVLPNHEGVWERRIPNQLLEAGWAAMILLGLCFLHGRMPFDGALFVFTSGAYATGRLVLEFAREQNRAKHGLTVHHAISLLIVALSIAALTAGESL
jgi:phosphatidylglycerol:prolipoprotein diacylglycerol transferase